MNYSCQPVIFVHSHGGMHGRRQRRAHQQTMFDKCAGDEHGRIEIFVRAAILFGEFIIFPFPENRQQGGNAHGKQRKTMPPGASLPSTIALFSISVN